MKKTNIREVLSSLKADLVKSLFIVVAQNLYMNPDLELALGDEAIREEMEEDIGAPLPIDTSEMMSQETLELYRAMKEYPEGKKAPTKGKCIDILEEVFDNDELFELICLLHQDEDIAEFMADLGCGEKYAELSSDRAYLERKEYTTCLYTYGLAAVNLYGVIHLTELEELIREYEGKRLKKFLVQRESGSYANTVLFNPKYFSTMFLGMMAENSFKGIAFAMGGLLAHPCFEGEASQENEEMISFMAKHGNSMDPDRLLDSFFEREKYYEFRELYDVASEKPMYRPGHSKFLDYADDCFMEDIPEAEAFERYLMEKYGSEIEAKLEAEDNPYHMGLEDHIAMVVVELRDIMSSNDQGKCLDNGTEFVQEALDFMDKCGIPMKDIDDVNQTLFYLMNIRNAERMWSNHGYTPQELMKLSPMTKPPVIVPGSSHAAKLLENSAEELSKMGLQIDTQMNATRIPVMGYANGLQGELTSSQVKKVYPNDPCPCGSGKKFKKCCGRNR